MPAMRWLVCVVLPLVFPSLAGAQTTAALGWALDRHDPPPAGDGMLAVEHPRHARSWDLAARIELGHAFMPLRLRRQYADTRVEYRAVIAGMSTATFDASTSFAGRASVDFSLPVSLQQSGEAALLGVLVVAPAEAPVLGDVRVGGRVRLYGRAEADPFSLHAGAWVWFPTGSRKGNTTDGSMRFEARLIAAGSVDIVRWSLVAGVRVRRELEGLNLALGHELHLRAGAAAALLHGRLRVGPELTLVTPLVALPDSADSAFFSVGQWGMELLLGAHLSVGHFMVSAGGGVGIERGGGTPTGRVLLSLTWRGDGTPAHARAALPASPTHVE